MENIRKSSVQDAGAPMIVALAGIGAIVLSIIGLIGVLPRVLASVTAIILGGALLAGGGAIVARYQEFFAGGEAFSESAFGGGMVMDSLVGIAGIVLGILALLGIDPASLLPASAIVFGGGLLLASGSLARMIQTTSAGESPASNWVARSSIYAASGLDLLAGAAAIVLGILALGSGNSVVLSLVAFLCVGTSILASGSALAGRFVGSF